MILLISEILICISSCTYGPTKGYKGTDSFVLFQFQSRRFNLLNISTSGRCFLILFLENCMPAQTFVCETQQSLLTPEFLKTCVAILLCTA